MSREPGERVPQLLLERLALDELPVAERDALAGRLGPQDREHIEAIAWSDREILAAHPPAAMAARIEQRLGAQRRRRRLLWIAAPMAAAAAVLLLVLALPLLQRGVLAPPDGVDQTRPKGEPMIFVFRKRGQRAEELRPGSAVAAGDLLQITYAAAGARHGVIVSVDGRGKLTLHHPEAADRSTALERQGLHALPFSYELDNAPRFERFFFVTSDDPIDVEGVLARAGQTLALHPGGQLQLPGLRIKELSLKKRQR